MKFRSEDQVLREAEKTLGFDDEEENVEQGTGQYTSFSRLGFPNNMKGKPDGWYLPKNHEKPAIILETKAENIDITGEGDPVKELKKNTDIVQSSYGKVIGILYNGKDIRVFKDGEERPDFSSALENKKYYIRKYEDKKLDKEEIFNITKRINNTLHFRFGMTYLQDRMIFTACTLVAQSCRHWDGLPGCLADSQNPENKTGSESKFARLQNWVKNTLEDEQKEGNTPFYNEKISVLIEEYSEVKMSITENPDAVDDFVRCVCQIAEMIHSDQWNGEDVMAIFFNEFNAYRGKTAAGQVFTPEHIASLMYRILGVTQNDRVLDATCGSGAFLVKSMCNMIQEAGGPGTEKAKEIQSSQIYGIEMYRKIYALCCANMLLHKDGKTNLIQEDAKSESAAEWISSKNITKVMMNPPYERKNKCAEIVENVLKSVPQGTDCAIILPDKKMEKEKKLQNLLKKHTLTTIIKLPENLFFGIGITTSIFIFKAKVPQNGRHIIGYYIEDDGLETVKNKGRHDVKGTWPEIENYWVRAIHDGNDYKYGTRQIIDPEEHLSYQMPLPPFEISDEDFEETVMIHALFERGTDIKEFQEGLIKKVLYNSRVSENEKGETVISFGGEKNEN